MNERIIVEIYGCLRDLGIDISYNEAVNMLNKLRVDSKKPQGESNENVES